MLTNIATFLVNMKPLRVFLVVFGLIIAVFATEAGTRADPDGIAAIYTLILPAITPLVFLVLLLDALMNRVWLIDASEEEQPRYRQIIRVDLVVALIIFIRWIPYFIDIW